MQLTMEVVTKLPLDFSLILLILKLRHVLQIAMSVKMPLHAIHVRTVMVMILQLKNVSINAFLTALHAGHPQHAMYVRLLTL
jgi:hypothetical protein